MTTAAQRKTLKQLAKSVRISCEYGAKLDYDKQDDWQRKSTGWHCTLRYRGRRYSFDFWQGQAITGEPTVEGTLECLISDCHAAQDNFENFCANFGYDTDSRKAEATYKACQKAQSNIKRLLGDDYETFLYADLN